MKYKDKSFYGLRFLIFVCLFVIAGQSAFAELKSSNGEGLFSGSLKVIGADGKKERIIAGNGEVIATNLDGSELALSPHIYDITVSGAGLLNDQAPRYKSGLINRDSRLGPLFGIFLPSHLGETVKLKARVKIDGGWRDLKIDKVGVKKGDTFKVPSAQFSIFDFFNADIVATLAPIQNKAPIVEAGTTKTINELEVITLNDATASDADKDPLSYQWTIVSGGGTLGNKASLNSATYKAPQVGVAGSIAILKLTVSDGKTTANDTVEVIVKNIPNELPVVAPGSYGPINELASVVLTPAATDADADALTFFWKILSGGGSLKVNADKTYTYTAPEVVWATEGIDKDVRLELSVSDGKDTVKKTVVIKVKNIANKTPVADAGPDQPQGKDLIKEASTVNLNGESSSDPEKAKLTFQWVQFVKSGGSVVKLKDGRTSTPSFVAPEVTPKGEDLVFKLTVDDGKNENSTASDTVTIHISSVNKAPKANAGDDIAAANNATVGLNGSAVDPDGDKMTYLWTQIGTPKVDLKDSKSLTPSFKAPDKIASLTFRLTVSDETMSDTDDVIVNVTKKVPPVAVATSYDYSEDTKGDGDHTTVKENHLLSLRADGSTDSDGEIKTYQWKQLSGKTVVINNANEKRASFTSPDLEEKNGKAVLIKPLLFLLTVIDNDGLKGTAKISISVIDDPNCFIATAAFGTPMASQIQVLRDFRDEYLMTNSLGRILVGYYYQNSPPVANYIAQRESFRTVTRWVLVPIIYVVKYPVLLLLFILSVITWRKRVVLLSFVVRKVANN